MKNRIQLGAIFILVVLALSLLLSQNASPAFPPLFALKRVQEKVYLSFKKSPADKAEYMSHLLDRRLGEIGSIVNNKNYDYLLKASLRYSTLAGEITDLVLINNLTEKLEPLKNQFISHQKILNDLYVIYPKNTDNLEYKYLEDDINYLDLYLDKLTKI